MTYQRLYFLVVSFFASVASAPALTITSGYFEKLSAEYSQQTFRLYGDDGSVFRDFENRIGSGEWRTQFCTATCLMDFSGFTASGLGLRSLAGVPVGYWFLDLNMTGPLVSATAVNRFPFSQFSTYDTDWGTAPVAITGTLSLRSLAHVETQVLNFTTAGIASAQSHYEVMQGPWNYTTARVDFVPEVASARYLLAGLVGVLLFRRRRPIG